MKGDRYKNPHTERISNQVIQEFWGLKGTLFVHIELSKSNRIYLKPNYFKKQRSSSSFLLTRSRYTGPKWPWSLSRLDPCLKWI